ncbi:MAG: hypothetical protein KDD06_17300 [Phaeodactylibacter sp.]|nr:hypothetical protein [Phaeodactylibacter sp.]MCB9290078.1 hypothetical protein [Lewinellaceae bacterium]
MKKWWNDLRRLWHSFLNRQTGQPEIRQSSGPGENAEHQSITFEAIRWYGRRKARRDARAVHRRLITEKPEGALARQLRRLFPGRNLR